MRYVTYDENGGVTGCYLQDLAEGHSAAYCEVDEQRALDWPAYHMNAARDGLDLTPVVPAPTPVPQKVTRRQGRQALLLAGKLDQVPLAIAAIEDETERRLAQIEWEDAQEYERQRPLVVLMGAALGLDLDALFIQAATL